MRRGCRCVPRNPASAVGTTLAVAAFSGDPSMHLAPRITLEEFLALQDSLQLGFESTRSFLLMVGGAIPSLTPRFQLLVVQRTSMISELNSCRSFENLATCRSSKCIAKPCRRVLVFLAETESLCCCGCSKRQGRHHVASH